MSNRIFYASHAVGISDVFDGDNNAEAPYAGNKETIDGVQSVSVNTNYNLEQIFQLGRLAIYDNFPTDPEVEVTINKALDGRELIWNHAIANDTGSLIDKANHKCTIVLHVDEDTQDAIDNDPNVAVVMTGCYVSSLNYTFPVDGNFTEEITFVGSSKETKFLAGEGLPGPPLADPNTRVLRRQNFRTDAEHTTLPAAVSGQCITSISISADLGREKMFCLGKYSPFHRYVNFPLEITVSFDINPNGSADSSLLGGTATDFAENTIDQCESANIAKEDILLSFCGVDGETVYSFNLGSGCSLQSVSYSGGDTGGGNVTETYTYITYNELTISFIA